MVEKATNLPHMERIFLKASGFVKQKAEAGRRPLLPDISSWEIRSQVSIMLETDVICRISDMRNDLP
jgi:hypothetical protein